LDAKIQKNGITLQCPHSKGWEKDGVNYTMKVSGENVNLVKLSDKDTGEYTCFDGHHDISAFVFVRLCQNCVQLDTSTISGIVVGDLIATLLIALATYCVSSSLNREGAHQDSRSVSPPLHLSRSPGITITPDCLTAQSVSLSVCLSVSNG
uniref:Uncharacterized protein n=1 Tax=Callorhinchus milii TaxID=7868 RepID=A0A4W3H304_CALMI